MDHDVLYIGKGVLQANFSHSQSRCQQNDPQQQGHYALNPLMPVGVGEIRFFLGTFTPIQAITVVITLEKE